MKATAKAIRYWGKVSLCGNSFFLAIYVLLPMAICGGVVNVEPNVYVRWIEFGISLTGSIVGTALMIRGERC